MNTENGRLMYETLLSRVKLCVVAELMRFHRVDFNQSTSRAKERSFMTGAVSSHELVMQASRGAVSKTKPENSCSALIISQCTYI